MNQALKSSSQSDKIRIAIVDDHVLFRAGLISLFDECDQYKIVFEAGNGHDAIEILKIRPVDIIFLDIEMPVMGGVEATKKIRAEYPDIKILILTMHDEEEMVFHLLENGANGYLLKDNDFDTINEAIQSVLSMGYYFNEKISKAMLARIVEQKKVIPKFEEEELSDREKEILKLLCHEKTNKEIADDLTISIRTVEGHRQSIMNKTGVKNLAGMVMYAVKKKLL